MKVNGHLFNEMIMNCKILIVQKNELIYYVISKIIN